MNRSHQKKIVLKIVFLLLLISFSFSCQDFIEVDPPATQLISATVYDDDLTAKAAISEIYSRMINGNGLASGGLGSATYLGALSSDELILSYTDNEVLQFSENAIIPSNAYILTLWNDTYTYIYLANSVIEGLNKSSKVSANLKNQLIGESKFIRAFCHFYLVNLFGDIPYISITDYRKNTTAPRISAAEVYQEILKDLKAARDLLADDYTYSKGERVRPNKWAATAMISRTYLFMGEWSNAELEATALIENNDQYDLDTPLNDIFLANSSEAIWQLMPSYQNYTNEGSVFVSSSYSMLREDLVTAFESGDNRKDNWIGSVTNDGVTSYFPFKYKNGYDAANLTEYSMVLRLAEQFLIRAEARVNQDKLTGINSAESDVNIIRNRAGLSNTLAGTKEELLAAIEKERRLEFFAEWAHRWLDLNRTGRANTIYLSIKPSWDTYDALYPIPEKEVLVNPNMSQNFGYK